MGGVTRDQGLAYLKELGVPEPTLVFLSYGEKAGVGAAWKRPDGLYLRHGVSLELAEAYKVTTEQLDVAAQQLREWYDAKRQAEAKAAPEA
jgi:hypothetical protein